ncbi:MAG: hypothetical protein KKE59_02945, partial [Proteobacteria bacterium]|nr:hypothetical protein [Pseudomonadota bacterium]
LSPFPRPPKTGYFYYKLPPKFSEWNVRTIAVLDLYNVDEEYLSNIFDEGIKKMLHRERLSGEAAYSVLEKYDTENIREFAQEILEEVVQGYVVKIRSAPQLNTLEGNPSEIRSAFHPSTMGPTYGAGRAGKKAQKMQNNPQITQIDAE